MIYVKQLGIINPDRIERVSDLLLLRFSSSTDPSGKTLGRHGVKFHIYFIDKKEPWTIEMHGDQFDSPQLVEARKVWADLRAGLCGNGVWL